MQKTAMADFEERRSTERMQRSEAAKIKVLTCDESSLVGRQFVGQTVDISPDGIRLHFAECLPLDSEVELCIALQGMPCTFYLKGHIRHCSAVDDGKRYLYGIEINDSPSADVLSWKALFGE